MNFLEVHTRLLNRYLLFLELFVDGLFCSSLCPVVSIQVKSHHRGLDAGRRVYQFGKKQAMDYANRLPRKYPQLNLKSFVVVALGMERICFVHLENP